MKYYGIGLAMIAVLGLSACDRSSQDDEARDRSVLSQDRDDDERDEQKNDRNDDDRDERQDKNDHDDDD